MKFWKYIVQKVKKLPFVFIVNFMKSIFNCCLFRISLCFENMGKIMCFWAPMSVDGGGAVTLHNCPLRQHAWELRKTWFFPCFFLSFPPYNEYIIKNRHTISTFVSVIPISKKTIKRAPMISVFFASAAHEAF